MQTRNLSHLTSLVISFPASPTQTQLSSPPIVPLLKPSMLLATILSTHTWLFPNLEVIESSHWVFQPSTLSAFIHYTTELAEQCMSILGFLPSFIKTKHLMTCYCQNNNHTRSLWPSIPPSPIEYSCMHHSCLDFSVQAPLLPQWYTHLSPDSSDISKCLDCIATSLGRIYLKGILCQPFAWSYPEVQSRISSGRSEVFVSPSRYLRITVWFMILFVD